MPPRAAPLVHRATAKAPTAPSSARLLARTCDCGNHAAGGTCAQCADDQRKKRVSRFTDRSAPPSHRPGVHGDEAVGGVPSIVHDVLRGTGHRLPASVQAFMEPRFGRDFGDVRVHHDGEAARSSSAVGALAYTVGSHIVFGAGRFQPDSAAGRHLLAHELAHVAQQPWGGSIDARPDTISDPADAAEIEAEAAAARVLSPGAPALAAPGRPASGPPPAVTRTGAVPTLVQQSSGVVRRQSDESSGAGVGALAGAASGSTGAGSAAPCIEEVEGEDPATLTEAGTVTFIEFGGDWCSPCRILKASLEAMCQSFAQKPPKSPVHIFSIDTAAEANEEIAKEYAPGSPPHLYIYVGHTLKDHYNTAVQPDVLDQALAEYTEEASQSPTWKGFKKGAKRGWKYGLGVGILGAIAVGKYTSLEGNDLTLGLLGAVGGGIAAGALVGGTIGAIAGRLGADKKGSHRKKKSKKPLRRARGWLEPEEREADALAATALQRPGRSTAPSPEAEPADGGAPLETAVRADMESRFGRDFGRVRVHRDARAHGVADGLQAYAVTEGDDIYFAPDGYAPQTPAGRAILAHELAHVAQQDIAAPTSSPASLEAEAAVVSARVVDGGRADVARGADAATPLPMKRWKKTLLGGAIGTVGVGAVGAAVGYGLAKWQGWDVGDAIKGGAIIGGIVGLIGGLITGYVRRRTDRVGAQEADLLIRRRYGRYLPGGVPAPLRGATIRPVSSAELCERMRCRSASAQCNAIGWTDTGAPWRGGQPPTDPIATPADEPVCNGKQMEHATPEHPVIYFQQDTPDAGILVHEGLHALAHPTFQALHDFVTEGTTELYTRRLLDDVNIAVHGSGYDDNVTEVKKFEALVGEEPLARAYFSGDLAGFDAAAAARLGPCSLERWALALQMYSGESREADAILAGRKIDYCAGQPSAFGGAAATPPPPPAGASGPHQQGGGAGGAKP